MDTFPYFENSRLQAHFSSSLDQALEGLSLSTEEGRWLRQLIHAPTLPTSMRVEAQVNAQPLASSCLIIHQRDPSLAAVYLYSPLRGVEGFDNLKQLHSALQSQQAHLGLLTEPLAFIELTHPAFEQWSRQLLEQQIDLLESLADSLNKLPTLRSTVEQAVKGAFGLLLEGADDIPEHRVQITASDTGDILRTESLVDTALQFFSGEAMGFGLQRRFLRGDAPTRDEVFERECETALGVTAGAVRGTLAQAMRDYWAGSDDESGSDRRQSLALALANNYAHTLARSAVEQSIDQEQLHWLRTVLIPDTQALGSWTLAFARSAPELGLPVPLADTLVFSLPDDPAKGYVVFNPITGLHPFADRDALEQHFTALLAHAERPDSITQEHWQQLPHTSPVEVVLTQIANAVFPTLADSLIALLNRRLDHALRFTGAQSTTAAATFEDALDIRAMLDYRLAKLGNMRRWSPVEGRKSQQGMPQLPSRSVTLPEKKAHARASIRLMQCLEDAQPRMREAVEELLAPAVTVLSEGHLRPRDLQIKQATLTLSLVDYFLLYVCSPSPKDLVTDVQLLDRSGMTVQWPTPTILNQQLNTLATGFTLAYMEQLQAFDSGHVRWGKGLVHIPGLVRTLHETWLRLELAQAREHKAIDSDLLDLLQQALDGPDQTLINAAFRLRGLKLKMPGKSPLTTLTACFVLQRSVAAEGSLLLCSPLEPLSQFANEQSLLEQMNGAFEDKEKLYRWLDLVHPEDLVKWHSPSIFPGVSVPELVLTSGFTDLFGHLTRTTINYRANVRRYYLSYAIRSQFTPALLAHFVDMQAEQHPVQKPLRRIAHTFENRYFHSLLPAWLAQATPSQMTIYAALVQASAKVSNPKFNYLFDVPDLDDFANRHLATALMNSYPSAPADPSQITVSYTHFTPNPVMTGEIPAPISADAVTTTTSLTEYALTHSDALANASNLKVFATRPDHTTIELDAIIIRTMVDRLDIASAFRALLTSKLSPSDPHHAKRRQRYAPGAVAYLLQEGYQRVLDKKLSPKGLYYLAHVLDQPDAMARVPVQGCNISISHLQLRAAEDFAPDTVRGMYMIGPDQADAGPVVLYSAYRPEGMLLEFDNPDALRSAILSDKALQKDILGRLPEAVQSRYDHKGFLHPHLFWSSADLFDFSTSPGAVQLVRSTIQGNSLHFLYEEHAAFLIEIGKARTVTTAEAYWKVFRYVLGLAVEQSSFFLPGKLAALLGSLQSIQWLKASSDAALKHNWGEALAEFVTALSGLAGSRASQSALSRKTLPTTTEHEPISLALPPCISSLGPLGSWHQRLSELQASDVQLNDLIKNNTLGLFLNPATDRFFAAVEGNAYEVGKSDGHWRILKGDSLGPQIKRVNGQWQVDLQQGLRGGGAAFSAFETATADMDIESRFTALASGMPDISTLHPVKHAVFVQAYGLGQQYLQTCLENLNSATPSAPLPPMTERILRDTFGHPASAQTLASLRDYTSRILNELLSTSMNPATSKRIVVGVNMPGARDTSAFVYTGDPGKRIFFTERSFDLTFEIAAYATPTRSELLAHQVAVTLIHELSHQTLKSVDIAYVEASAPFVDLISRQTQGGRKAYQTILSYRRDGLSVNSNIHTLFQTYENLAWRDLRHSDGSALKTIFRLTGQTTLPAARNTFYNDPDVRTLIILANADSLALLISKLGRRRFASAG
jgi:hypothetical protein